MTTPVLNTAASGLSTVRYYTPFDPYFYTVDNRPLTDLAANDNIVASAADAARRAALLNGLAQGLYAQSNLGSNSRFIAGLAVSNPSANTVAIGTGYVLENLPIVTGETRNVLKLGLNVDTPQFNVAQPATAGTEIMYTVCGQYTDIGSAALGFPLNDPSNTFLPASTMVGQLALQVIAGSPATIGSSAPGTIPGGWFPIYNLVVQYGSTTFTVAAHAQCPASAGLNTIHKPVTTGATLGDTPVTALADSGSPYALFSVNNIAPLNPYKSLKLKLNFIPTVATTGGATFKFNVYYAFVGAGTDLTNITYTQAGSDSLNLNTPVNTLTSYTSAVTIPLNGLGTNQKIYVKVVRDISDTYTGTINVLDAIVSQ